HVTWSGRVYGQGLVRFGRGRIYHGAWGSAPFQSLYQAAPSTFWSLVATPEWMLVVVALGGLSLLGLLWRPLLLGLVLFVIAALLPLISAGLAAARATFPISYGPRTRAQLRILVGFLYLTQPLARLLGRLQAGLTPWRRRGTPGLASPLPRTVSLWSDHWRDLEERLRAIEATLKLAGAVVKRGSDMKTMATYSDVVVFRRLLREARPSWPYIALLFLLSLLASPLALLTPLPLKIAVDSVIGSRPLPGVIAPFVPGGIASSPELLLIFSVGLLL